MKIAFKTGDLIGCGTEGMGGEPYCGASAPEPQTMCFFAPLSMAKLGPAGGLCGELSGM